MSQLDRLTRHGLHLKALLGELHAAGAKLVTAEDRFGSETPGLDSREDVKVMGAIVTYAECQRDRISDATRRALRNLRREGKAFSRDLYGFDDENGEFVPNFDELAVLGKIRRWSEQGKSLNRIAKDLDAAGHRGKRGGKWQAKTVRDQLRRLEAPELKELYDLLTNL